MRKPTLMDVAERAGVSYATADRVLNRRGGVAQKSIIRVQNAINELGYKRDVTAANLARRHSYHFTFLIPSHAGDFFDELHQELQKQAPEYLAQRIVIKIQKYPAFNPHALLEALGTCAEDNPSGICLVGIDTPELCAALQKLREKGIVVVTLITDIQPTRRDAYIGLDNLAAGRTAGRLMALTHRNGGIILPILGTLNAQDHAQRLEGFQQRLPFNVTMLPPVECYDQPDKVTAAVRFALETHPNLSGIYNMGSGNSGLIKALKNMPKSLSFRRPTVIVHDLLDDIRTALSLDLIDAVIDQKPAEQITKALDTLKHLCDGDPLSKNDGMILPSLYLQDNLPPQPIESTQNETLFRRHYPDQI